MDVVCLLVVSSAILLLFTIILIAFGVPNTVGLDRSSLWKFLSPAVNFIDQNKSAVGWSCLLAVFAIPAFLRLIVLVPRIGWETRLAINRLYRATRAEARRHTPQLDAALQKQRTPSLTRWRAKARRRARQAAIKASSLEANVSHTSAGQRSA